MDPQAVADMFRQGTLHHQAGRLKQAESLYRSVLQFDKTNAFCMQQLGLLLAQIDRGKEGVPLLEKSCHLRADIPAFWNNLGELYRQVDRLTESAQAFQKALNMSPFFPEAHYNLANTLKQLGRHGEAVSHYHEAIRHKPNYDRAWYNLGNTLREEGRVVTAVEAYRKALELKPDWADAHLNLANALFDMRDLDTAAESYRKAAALQPDDADLADSLGNCLVAAGKTAEAIEAYRRAGSRRPEKWLRALRCDLLALPVVPNLAFIDEYRQRIPDILNRYSDRGPTDLAELHTSGVEPPMLLAYHGRDDRPLKEQFSRFFRERLPTFDPPAKRSGKPMLGVVVTHGHEGVFARCLGPLIARLDRTQLDVKLIVIRAGANVLQHMLPDAGFDFVLLPERVDEANQRLREIGFDVLLYWEIGTDSMNYFLPLFRPARVQVNCWGWPVTSGHAGVQRYLSWEQLEPPNGQEHYTEPLVRLRQLPTYYLRPPAPTAPRPKEAFGFAATERLYLCQQNVRKYHPDFDAGLAGILRGDPNGIIGIIADEQPAITELLMTRLRTAMLDVGHRLRVIARLEREAYLELVAAADVVLDTPHYGGGANTVLDAIAVGTPIVTWPGPFHRGRWAGAVNQSLGVNELNVPTLGDYAPLAIDIACNVERRKVVGERVRAAGQELFEIGAAVREWQEWFVAAAMMA
jgi:predicted O-linked N-acetylglucosamine transferase (SPINDLY family)